MTCDLEFADCAPRPPAPSPGELCPVNEVDGSKHSPPPWASLRGTVPMLVECAYESGWLTAAGNPASFQSLGQGACDSLLRNTPPSLLFLLYQP